MRNRSWSRLGIGLVGTAMAFGATACATQENAQPNCGADSPTVLMAESVPSASLIPCVEVLPAGWSYGAFEANDRGSTFSLEEPERGGLLEVELLSSCEASGTSTTLRGFPSAQQYRSVQADGARVVWTSVFPGGCSRAQLTFAAPPPSSDVAMIYRAISFVSREQLHET